MKRTLALSLFFARSHSFASPPSTSSISSLSPSIIAIAAAPRLSRYQTCSVATSTSTSASTSTSTSEVLATTLTGAASLRSIYQKSTPYIGRGDVVVTAASVVASRWMSKWWLLLLNTVDFNNGPIGIYCTCWKPKWLTFSEAAFKRCDEIPFHKGCPQVSERTCV